jgi:hemerythrin-like metal-binding protein
MPFMQWTDLLTIDGGPIDHQHRQMVEALNAFHDAVVLGSAFTQLGETLSFLTLYSDLHFRDEETLMARASYPKLETHRRQHRLFSDQVGAFRAQIEAGGSAVAHDMARFLGSWLVNHIMVEDKAFASFLRGSTRLPAVVMMMEGVE